MHSYCVTSPVLKTNALMVKKTQSLKRPPRLVVETEDKTFQYSARSAAVRANTDLWSPTQEEGWSLKTKRKAGGSREGESEVMGRSGKTLEGRENGIYKQQVDVTGSWKTSSTCEGVGNLSWGRCGSIESFKPEAGTDHVCLSSWRLYMGAES